MRLDSYQFLIIFSFALVSSPRCTADHESSEYAYLTKSVNHGDGSRFFENSTKTVNDSVSIFASRRRRRLQFEGMFENMQVKGE